MRGVDPPAIEGARAEIAAIFRVELDRFIDPELEELSADIMNRLKERSEE